MTLVALLIYIACILLATLSDRSSAAESHFQLQLFWSYIRWFRGDSSLGREIILNVGLFAPLGFLAASAFQKTGKRRIFFAVVLGLCLSVCIEFSQLWFHLGLAELDDILNNTLGTVIGAGAERILCAITKEKLRRILLIVCSVICVAAGILGCVYLKLSRDYSAEQANTFDLDTFEEQDGKLIFTGFIFSWDEAEPGKPILLLTTDHLIYIPVKLTGGIDRPEVSEYYFGDDSRRACGYAAQVKTGRLNPEKEYDLMVIWPGEVLPSYTGWYVSSENSQWIMRCISRYYSGDLDLTGTNLTELQQNGTLKYYNEQYGSYLLQDRNRLYLIVEKDKAPDELEDVLVTAELEISRPELLTADEQPDADARAEGLLDLTETFAEGEITDETQTGKYRVFCVEVPDGLPVKSVDIGLRDPVSGKDYWTWQTGMQPTFD